MYFLFKEQNIEGEFAKNTTLSHHYYQCHHNHSPIAYSEPSNSCGV